MKFIQATESEFIDASGISGFEVDAFEDENGNMQPAVTLTWDMPYKQLQYTGVEAMRMIQQLHPKGSGEYSLPENLGPEGSWAIRFNGRCLCIRHTKDLWEAMEMASDANVPFDEQSTLVELLNSVQGG